MARRHATGGGAAARLGFANPLPPARRFWQPDTNPVVLGVGRKEEAARRRVALRAILDERVRLGEPWPGLRELCQRLRQVGHEPSTRTVAKDLVALGIANPMAGSAVE